MKILKSLLLMGVLLLSVQGVFAQVSVGGYTISSQTTANAGAVVCTMDAMLCPDGVTYVGRIGPSCAFAACPSGISPIPPVSTCADLQYNLKEGSLDANTNGEVTKLQNFLYPKYLAVSATGGFYGMTRNAVMKLQSEYGISPAVGYVGPVTRAKIKQLTCGGTSQTLAINSMSLSVAKIGQTIALSGPGLNSGGDYILFDGYRIETDGSKALNRISFVVPEYLSNTINCIKAPCPLGLVRQVLPGFYSIKVVNNQGSTNTVTLQITDGAVVAPPNDTIEISWVEPSAAKVGESVVIYGYNLFRPETRILFDGYSIAGSPVYSKRAGDFNSALEFKVPSNFSSCIGNQCSLGQQVLPGAHKLAVDNKYGTDSVEFEVLGPLTLGRKPYLNTSTPTQGVVGIEVAVFGENINRGSEKLYFGGSQVLPLISSATDQKGVIRFRIPEYITPCGYEDNTACRMMAQFVTPGKYDIVVKNDYGISNIISFAVTSGTVSTPKLNLLTPSAGLIGTEVAISGDGINVGGDQIYFGGSLITAAVSSSVDTVNVLRFRVPGSITPCGVGGQNLCKIASRPVTPGSYEVAVVNGRGTSNTLSFTVTSSTTNPPTISGVSGPQTLSVNQQGTWTVTASNPSGGNLSYGVVWGDEAIAGSGNSNTAIQTSQQTATFTHVYYQNGTYTPRFTVTNTSGQSATASLSVNVGNTTVQPPTLSSLSPSVGVTGTQITITGTGFTSTGNKVNFGQLVNVNGPYNSSDGKTITFVVPGFSSINGNVIQPGNYAVSVTNANGASNALNFAVTSGTNVTPAISSLSPASGSVGTRVIILGTNINTNEEVVTFGGSLNYVDIVQPRQQGRVEFIIPSSTGASCPRFTTNPVCPPGAEQSVVPGVYEVTVANRNGTSNRMSFTVTSATNNAPVVSTVNPASIIVGTEVTLTGERLNTGGPIVIFGNGRITPSPMRINDSTLTFVVPSSMSRYCAPGLFCTDDMIPVTSGNYDVKVLNSFGMSNARIVTVSTQTVNSPTISSLSQNSGGTGVAVIVYGSGIAFTDTVNFGTITIAPDQTYKVANQIRFIIPTTLNTCTGICPDFFQPTPLGGYSVSVTDLKGMKTNALQYTVTSNGSSSNF